MTGHGGKRTGAGRKPRPYPEQILKLRATPDELAQIHNLDTRARALALLKRSEEMDSSRQIEDIRVEYSEAALFGDLDPGAEGYDARESARRFGEILESEIEDIYPKADVEVVLGDIDRVRVNGMTNHDEVTWIEQIIERVYGSNKWAYVPDVKTITLSEHEPRQTDAGASGMAYQAGDQVTIFYRNGTYGAVFHGVTWDGNAYESDDLTGFETAEEAEAEARANYQPHD